MRVNRYKSLTVARMVQLLSGEGQSVVGDGAGVELTGEDELSTRRLSMVAAK